MKTLILSLLLAISYLMLATSSAQNATPLTETWNDLLSTYVNEPGKVDYQAWLDNDDDISTIQGIVEQLATTDPSSFASENHQLAFWVNVYNILAIQEVLNRYPIDTVRPEFFFIPERSFFTDVKHVVNGNTYSLDGIENDIIRADFEQPLIHFGIVCASTSCPDLRNEAYTGEKVLVQLEEEARAFLADPTKNILEGNSVQISKIFDWFKGDFEAGFGNVANFLIAYGPQGSIECEDMDCSTLNISYQDYDWSLNKQ